MAKYEDPNQLDYRNGGDTVDDFAQKYMRTIAYVFKALNDLRTPTGNTAGVEPEPYMWRIADNKLYIRNGDNTDYVLLGEISPNFGFRQSVNDRFLTTADLEGDGAVVTRNEAGKVEGDITGSPGKIAGKTIDVTPSADNDVIAYDAAQQKWVKKTLNDYLKKQGDAGWDEMVDEVADQVIEDITPIIFNFWYLDDDGYLVPLVGSTEGGLPSIHGMVGDYEQITARSVDVAGNLSATGNVTAGMVTTPQANVTTLTANAVNAGTVTADDIIAKGPVVDVRAFGAKGDGVHDDTEAISNAIAYAETIDAGCVIPNGTYLVTSTITVSGVTVYGLNQASITSNVQVFAAKSYTRITGVKFSLKAAVVAIVATGSYIHVDNCKCASGGLVSFDHAYFSGAENNNCINCTYAKGAIEIVFSSDISVSNNLINTAVHGIQFWGNESKLYPSSTIDSNRLTYRISITGNIIKNVHGGGIWGSCGEYITIDGNVVEKCGDVGIDMEGCANSIISNNTVKNCVNGCLTIFHSTKNVSFNSNFCEQDGTDGIEFFKAYADGIIGEEKDSVTVSNNTFSYTGTGIGSAFSNIVGCVKNFIFTKNYCYNVSVSLHANTAIRFVITDNEFIFNGNGITSNFNALCLGRFSPCNAVIARNNIINKTSYTGGHGIFIDLLIASNANLTIIDNNILNGFNTSINYLSWVDGGTGVINYCLMRDNIIDGILRNGNGTWGTVRLDSNRNMDGTEHTDITIVG